MEADTANETTATSGINIHFTENNMRMKTLRHLLPLLPLALLAACSNDQVLPDDLPADAGITTVIAYAPGAGQPATRTTLGPQSEDGSYPTSVP